MILFIAQGYDTRELFAFEVFQGSAAARGDVADLVGQAGLVDSRDGVTAADDRNSIGISNGFGDCFRTFSIVSISNTPIGPFQTMSFIGASSLAKSSRVFVPTSRIIQSAGTASTETTL